MGETSLSSHVDQQNTGKRKWSIIGPGLIVAATGVGAGDLVAALVAGSRYGLVFLWAIIIGAVIKFTLNEGVGRWHVTSGKTILEGWRSIGPWATGYFGIYTLIWGFVYGAAGMSSCALAMTTMFPVIPLWAWAIIHGLVGFILIWSGKYKMFENVMTLLVGLMFITVVGVCSSCDSGSWTYNEYSFPFIAKRLFNLCTRSHRRRWRLYYDGLLWLLAI